jgi:hypothetical protein
VRLDLIPFVSAGFLQAHISYLDPDYHVCLLLFSTERDTETFAELSASRAAITEQMTSLKCLDAIGQSLARGNYRMCM